MNNYSFGLDSNAGAAFGGGGGLPFSSGSTPVSNYQFTLGSDASSMLGQQFSQTRQDVLGGKMDYYFQLGSQLMQAVQQLAQPQQPQAAGGGSSGGGSGGNYSPNLTSGFDYNWLNRQTNIASAQGHSIQNPG